MSGLFLWIGLTFIVGLPKVLPLFNGGAGVGIFEIVGGVLMVIGSILLIVKK